MAEFNEFKYSRLLSVILALLKLKNMKYLLTYYYANIYCILNQYVITIIIPIYI